MSRWMSSVGLAAAVVCMTAVASLAQQTTTSKETKSFEVIAVDGNHLVVRLPEGTKELTVPEDFRFMVNGQPLSVRELKAGMKGTAEVTTRTTITPVTVTEVKNGTVMKRAGNSIIVRTEENTIKMFSEGDVDKRGVKLLRGGQPAELADFSEGDKLSATIITSKPPRVMTEKEVRAYVPAPAAPAGEAPQVAAARAPSGPAPTAAPARTLPKTASSSPLLALASALLIGIGLGLTLTRRFVQ